MRSLELIACIASLACSQAAARAQSPSRGAGNEISVARQSGATLAETELQRGISLTRQGRFREAIPHLFAARGHVAEEYAAEFDLALCYVGTRQYKQAIPILANIQDGDAGNVSNLLAQAYIGDGEWKRGFTAFKRAARIQPKNEKLYLFLADAYEGQDAYSMGLQVVDEGLKNLPRSARLTYERGVILSQLNQTDLAEKSFERVTKLSPGGEFSYLAAAQADLLQGNIEQAVEDTRSGINRGYHDYALLTLFGQAVDRSGVSPKRAEFAEAEKSLEEAIAEHPDFAPAQISLGKLMLRGGNAEGSIAHLEAARKLTPDDPSIYAHLAAAYREHGDPQKAREMLLTLAKLNREQAAKYKSGSPNHKIGYVASAAGRASQPNPLH